MSSREFNQDVSQAKRDARVEPVFVTDRGRPTHVLLSIETFQRLNGEVDSIVESLAMDDAPELVDPSSTAAWVRRPAGR